jgi:TetR/AcrR family transcriptional regulator
MAVSTIHADSATRQHLLRAALKSFAERGYAGTSVRQIVAAARVSKPALYYYFSDKAAIFEALVDQAHDERYRLMQAAVARGQTVAEKLEELVGDLFAFSLQNRELMRIAFATAFASTREAPGNAKCRGKGRRNYEFIRSLMADGQAAGELDGRFSPDELAMGLYGQLNTYVMVRLLAAECPLNHETACQIVRLFLRGAGVCRNPANRSGNGAVSLPTGKRAALTAAPPTRRTVALKRKIIAK